MKYKEMTVWSAGKNAKTKKVEFAMGIVIFIMWLVICVLSFTQNMNDDKTVEMKMWEHILCGVFMSLLTSIFGLIGYAIASLAKDAIKRNAEFTLYLYNFDDFMKLNGKPMGKEIVFCDRCGFVLCDRGNETLYNDWQCIPDSQLYFFKFEEFYEKYKGNKREIEIMDNYKEDRNGQVF